MAQKNLRNVFGALASAVLLNFFALPAAAQESGESCGLLADDAARLGCYDALFRPGANGSSGAPLVLRSERLIPGRPSGREPATLTIACIDGAPVASFAFAGQLVSATGDIAPVTLQIDQNQTAVRALSASDDNTALSFNGRRDTTAFLDSLDGGSSLKVRVTPIGQRSITVNFALDDVLDDIGALRENCR